MKAASSASRSGNPHRFNVRARSSDSSCGKRGSTWESGMTATGPPRHEGSDWMAGLGSFVGELLMTRPSGFSLPPLPSFLLILLPTMHGADSGPYNSVRVCSSEIIPTDK